MRRSLASFMMLWFAVTTVDPEALHQCEMHGGSHAVSEVVADEHAGHDGSHASSAATPVAPESPAAPESDDTHHCSCLGECCSAVVTSVPDQPVAAYAPESVRRDVVRVAVESTVSAFPGLRLPFATAPPALPGTPS